MLLFAQIRGKLSHRQKCDCTQKSSFPPLSLSGCIFYGLRAQQTRLPLYGDIMVWYNMFILFAMYCMMPVPVKWCAVCCALTGTVHVTLMVFVTTGGDDDEEEDIPSVSSTYVVQRNLDIVVLHTSEHYVSDA